MKPQQLTFQNLISQLNKFRDAEKRQRLLFSVTSWILYIVLLLTILVFVESCILFSQGIRKILFFSFASFIVLTVVVYIVLPAIDLLFRKNHPSLNDIALLIGAQSGFMQDRLANALQLVMQKKQSQEHYSEQLIDEALESVCKLLTAKDFLQISDRNKIKKRAHTLWFALVCILILVITFPNFWQTGFNRLMFPNKYQFMRHSIVLRVKPGNVIIQKGEDLQVSAWIEGKTVNGMTLNVFRFGQEEKLNMENRRGDTLYYVLPAVKDTLQYSVIYKKIKSELYTVIITEFPILRSLQVKLLPPIYTRQQEILLEKNIGDISALKGTRVEWWAEANKDLKNGQLLFDKGPMIPLKITGERAFAEFIISEDDVYKYDLIDGQEMQSSNPIKYHIKQIFDQYPYIRILSPAKDIDLDEKMQIPLVIHAQDDYGIKHIKLGYQIFSNAHAETDTNRFLYQQLPTPAGDLEQVQMAFNWDLSKTPLLPNEVLLYFVEVYDNDTISGPKRARSTIYRARFPSIYELYEEINQSQEESIQQYEKVYEKSKKLKDKISGLAQQLKRTDELSWQKKQEIDETMKQQREMHENLDKVSQKLDEMIEKMEQNKLLSPETLQKYREVQKLYQEIMTPELQKALDKVSDAMQKIEQNLLQKALNDLKLSEDSFINSLDRTISLLKRLKLQQKVDQSIRMAKDIVDRQNKLAEQFQKDLSNKEKSIKEQDELKTNTNELNSHIQELQEEMKKDIDLPQREISQASEAISKAKIPEQMENNKQQIQKGNSDGVKKISTQISSDMNTTIQLLQQTSGALSGAMQQRAAKAMREGINNLLTLSKMQENLKEETRALPEATAKMQEAAEAQQHLYSGLQRVSNDLYQASKENFGIKSNIGASLGRATNHMQQSLQAFEGREVDRTVSEQGQAMSAINEAILQLFSSLQSMKQGGKGGGMSMEQFLQQLQGLSSMQQGINMETLSIGMGERMSLAQQAAISRLTAQQGAVRKTLEELMNEVGEMSENLGNMDKVVEEMKAVENDFANMQIGRETIERQNRILSRMLDSQKSMKEREYSRKRKAETGKVYSNESPDELPADLGDRRNQLQRDLLRAKKEGYTRDYLELIKEYFEALTDRENKETRP